MYADDLLAIGANAAKVDRFFYSLASLSIGRFSKFFGVRVTFNDDGGYNFDQEEAIGDLLRYNMLAGANPTRAPPTTQS